ncbi:MAG: hypothetical protein H6621_02320 [Halobacteriovoraceae bacterium]|nr:hypothetical protein [Halobacteriovoraceae bacterium]MCB9093879.1 hypothetical protein [Halobacteriovoraceae bacterium]
MKKIFLIFILLHFSHTLFARDLCQEAQERYQSSFFSSKSDLEECRSINDSIRSHYDQATASEVLGFCLEAYEGSPQVSKVFMNINKCFKTSRKILYKSDICKLEEIVNKCVDEYQEVTIVRYMYGTTPLQECLEENI